eukprot:Skav236426  [mRNA]  locus=scaffold1156:11970:13165:+ [translate_table: standard]
MFWQLSEASPAPRLGDDNSRLTKVNVQDTVVFHSEAKRTRPHFPLAVSQAVIPSSKDGTSTAMSSSAAEAGRPPSTFLSGWNEFSGAFQWTEYRKQLATQAGSKATRQRRWHGASGAPTK